MRVVAGKRRRYSKLMLVPGSYPSFTPEGLQWLFLLQRSALVTISSLLPAVNLLIFVLPLFLYLSPSLLQSLILITLHCSQSDLEETLTSSPPLQPLGIAPTRASLQPWSSISLLQHIFMPILHSLSITLLLSRSQIPYYSDCDPTLIPSQVLVLSSSGNVDEYPAET